MNPYENLPDSAYWRTAVASRNMFDIADIWDPKFPIRPDDKIVTFGSCFAQHIGKALAERGYSWTSTEPPPSGLSKENCRKFNYDVFSCRTGNIYTTSLLRQWTEWALEIKAAPGEVWEKDGRYYDPFRPVIEPDGFVSVEELTQSRQQTIASFRKAMETADVFVFTLGLTESWFNVGGYEYPMCPGTAGGVFSQDAHFFKNQPFDFVLGNLNAAIDLMRQRNEKLRFILTVSPVPLVATRSGRHVLVATTESKSVLRAVAGQVSASREPVDYFPSYELVTGAPFRATFFEPNQRNVNPHGVNFVMKAFFDGLHSKFGQPQEPLRRSAGSASPDFDDIVCEEELLAAFGGAT